MRGRPSKFNMVKWQQIQLHISQGLPIKSACYQVGVCRDTYYDWIKIVKVLEKYGQCHFNQDTN